MDVQAREDLEEHAINRWIVVDKHGRVMARRMSREVAVQVARSLGADIEEQLDAERDMRQKREEVLEYAQTTAIERGTKLAEANATIQRQAATINSFINAADPEMYFDGGLIPINANSMRHLIDTIERLRGEVEQERKVSVREHHHALHREELLTRQIKSAREVLREAKHVVAGARKRAELRDESARELNALLERIDAFLTPEPAEEQPAGEESEQFPARKFGIWQKTECDECGLEFQVSRSREVEYPKGKPVVCEGCEMYARGHSDGRQADEALLRRCRQRLDASNFVDFELCNDLDARLGKSETKS